MLLHQSCSEFYSSDLHLRCRDGEQDCKQCGVGFDSRPVFTNKTYIVTVIADVGSGLFDTGMTHQGVAHHRCLEGNINDGPHPSMGHWFAVTCLSGVGFAGLGLLFTKLSLSRWMVAGLAPYSMQVHIRAGIRWGENCW